MTLEETLKAVLISRDQDEIVLTVPRLVSSAIDRNAAKKTAEEIISDYLLSDDREVRLIAALGLYALTLADMGSGSVAENLVNASISSETFERLLAAIAIETNPKVKAEQLWALAAQSFEGRLRQYATLVANLTRAVLESKVFPASKDTLGRMLYAYEKLRKLGATRENPPEIQQRELLGYAATGVPFNLEVPNKQEVIIIYNYNLEAWLPPGGHFEPVSGEVPDSALIKRIKDEIGADCEPIWEGREFRSRDDAALLACPSFVLLEDLRKMKTAATEIHAFHYDLVYICKVTKDSVNRIGTGSLPAISIPLDNLPATDIRKSLRQRIIEYIPDTHRKNVPGNVIERIVISLDIIKTHWGEPLGRKIERRAREHLWKADPPKTWPATPQNMLNGTVIRMPDNGA